MKTIRDSIEKALRFSELAHIYALEIDRKLHALGKEPIVFSASGVSAHCMTTVKEFGLDELFMNHGRMADTNAIYEAEAMVKEGLRSEAIAHAFAFARGQQINGLNIFYANHATARPELRRYHLNKYLSAYGLSVKLEQGENSNFFRRLKSGKILQNIDGPLVTVIMPTYNAESTIELAMNSLLVQSWWNLQIIIVNDASTDNTLQKAKQIAERDPRVKVLSNPVNVGAYVSRNLGVLHARGKWLTVHDSDDWAFPDRIEQQVNALMDTNAHTCTGGMLRMDVYGKITRPSSVLGNSADGYQRMCFASLMVQTEVFRKELGAWDSVRVEGDAELIMRLKALGFKNTHLNRPLMVCLDDAEGLTNHVELGLMDNFGQLNQVRSDYRQSFEKWHGSTGSKKLSPNAYERVFQAPTAITIAHSDLRKIFDKNNSNLLTSLEIKNDIVIQKTNIKRNNISSVHNFQNYLNDLNKKQYLENSAILQESYSNSDDLVLVLIPAFNAERTIVSSVKSVLAQTHSNTRVVIIDDASTDKTYEIITNLKCEDARVYILRNQFNKGPFYSVNIGLFLFRWFRFNYFLKHDADDLMLPQKLRCQVTALARNKSAYFCTTGYTQLDFNTHAVIRHVARGHNMTMYRAEVFRRLGYFDDTRFGGDSEYLDLAIAAYGEDSEIHLEEVFTHAYFLETGIVSNNPLGSPKRQAFQKEYRALHARMAGDGFIFRNFDCQQELFNHLRSQRPIICGVATIQSRKKGLRQAIDAILPQVDKLIVYQNDYKEMMDFLKDEKIEVISALDTGIDMGDAGKYYRLKDFDDVIYFSIDDDLIYPSNYVDSILDVLASYDHQVIVSAHGRLCMPHIKSYYNDKLKLYHFSDEISHVSEAHFGGTGVMAFNTKTVKIEFNDFKHPNMADIWLGLHARINNIPIYIIPHSANWIALSDHIDIKESIFNRTKVADPRLSDTIKVTTDLITKENFSYIYTFDSVKKIINPAIIIQPKLTPYFISTARRIIVVIPTFNRKEFLVRLMQQLDVAALFFKVHVVIFDDGSENPVRNNFFNTVNLVDIEIHRYSNHGKKKYWSLVNKIFDRVSHLDADYYFYLGDDLEVNSDFFIRSITEWESIADDNKISLNLLRDSRTKAWTDFEAVEREFTGFHVLQTQWLDMIMLFDKKMLSHRLTEVPLSRWDKNPLLSSGVGAQLSQRFHQIGYGMYQVMSSIVCHGEHDSEMNPEERRKNPLTAQI